MGFAAATTQDHCLATNAELRAVARVTLRELKKEIDEALPKVKDSSTKMHLMDLSAEIAEIFETAKKS